MSTIQIWDSFHPGIDITEDTLNDGLDIRISDNVTPLPEELEARVNEVWKKQGKDLKDNPILYLLVPTSRSQSDKPEIVTNSRGFRYTQAFNRNPNFGTEKDINNYFLLSLSTHCHIITKDNKILFGVKRNQKDQISGFGGFPNLNEETIENKGKKYLNIHKTLNRQLSKEIGNLSNSIDTKRFTGIVYVNTPRLRGVDSTYLIQLDETSNNAKKRFKKSPQFKRELLTVDFNPNSLINFFKEVKSQRKVMSNYTLGCSYNTIKAHFGPEEASRFLGKMQNIEIPISANYPGAIKEV